MPLLSLVEASTALAYYATFGRASDLILTAGLSLLHNRQWFLGKVNFDFLKLVSVGSISAVLVAFSISKLLQWGGNPPSTRWSGPGKPLLFPCRTNHVRMFPKRHSFSYSYLVVGIPVGWEGTSAGMISAGAGKMSESGSPLSSTETPRTAWLHINPADYLEHGQGSLGLRGKLDAYLRSQGIDPSQYPHAYLITAARFLGYHFNPVSFWYLYTAERVMEAMVLEVNNTFGERRIYLVTKAEPSALGTHDASNPGESFSDDNSTATNPSTSEATDQTWLRNSWKKDFHVSPFNSRKGSYSVVANDPLQPSMSGHGPVSVTVSLRSSKGHGKIVARLFSEGPSMDPEAMPLYQKWGFLAGWWWVGFVTVPRIIKEAAALFFRRNLHVWFRPEPLKESMGRPADASERQLERVFRRYLRHLVNQSTSALAIKYIPSGVPGASKEFMLSPASRGATRDVEEVEFKVLTPIFYSRFAYYAHDMEALFCEFRDNCTLWISKPEAVARLGLRKPQPPLETSSYVDYAYFKAIQRLRRRPERIERPMTSKQTPTTGRQEDIRGFRISSMDGYVLAQEGADVRTAYRSTVLKLFVADRIALGNITILETEFFLFRVLVAWTLVHALDKLVPIRSIVNIFG